MRKQRNEKNEKTEVLQKKWRKQRKKAGKVQQVIDGGGVQLGTSERPGRCQPSPLRKKYLSKGPSKRRTTKPKNKTQNRRTDLGFVAKSRMEYKSRTRVTSKRLNQKRKRVNGRDGAPALMHRPAAIEAAPSPEKRGECSHTASRPYSAAARAPV